jgi:hypothetical protein
LAPVLRHYCHYCTPSLLSLLHCSQSVHCHILLMSYSAPLRPPVPPPLLSPRRFLTPLSTPLCTVVFPPTRLDSALLSYLCSQRCHPYDDSYVDSTVGHHTERNTVSRLNVVYHHCPCKLEAISFIVATPTLTTTPLKHERREGQPLLLNLRLSLATSMAVHTHARHKCQPVM